MATVLKGAPVAAEINQELSERIAMLRQHGINPTLCTIRVGESPDDISYETGAAKRAAKLGVEHVKVVLPDSATQDEVIAAICEANNNPAVHGILVFRPLPKHIDDAAIRAALCPDKDVDGITEGSLNGVFTGSGKGFPPCTAQACIEILERTGTELKGKNAVVIGRSLVIGKPVAMMLLQKNATVTICHTRTVDTPTIAKRGDIIVAAAGSAGMVNANYLSSGQTVIDVGINVSDEGKLCGDVKFDEAEAIVERITPVPGGVGAVTTSVLMSHVVESAMRTLK